MRLNNAAISSSYGWPKWMPSPMGHRTTIAAYKVLKSLGYRKVPKRQQPPSIDRSQGLAEYTGMWLWNLRYLISGLYVSSLMDNQLSDRLAWSQQARGKQLINRGARYRC